MRLKFWSLSFLGLAVVLHGSPIDGPSTAMLTDDQLESVASKKESHGFQAEVARLMDIIINSLYSQREVFLRELISNAADALEKARFLALSDPKMLMDKRPLEIYVDVNETAKTLSITDTGVGMTKDDLINNLGTVAKSGTTNFLEALAQGQEVNLIGQFGVGFYSAFLAADRVVVVSKNLKDDQHIWESSADSSFSVFKDPRGNTLGRGTRITLHLKEDATDFLRESKLRELVRKFSQFIQFPIKLLVEKDEVVDTPTDAPDSEGELEDVDEGKKENQAKETKKVAVWEHLNTEKAIWIRNKDNVTEQEYNDFYRVLSSDVQDPLAWTHFTAEGDVEFQALLFVPGAKAFDAWQTYFAQKQDAIKLYARRVLVADQFTDIVPKWMSFVRGVVDSDDLPLKVDRESLSQSIAMTKITKKLTRKYLELLKNMSSEDEKQKAAGNSSETKFDQFWKVFGRTTKVACIEDEQNRDKVSKMFRYRSSKTGANSTITLAQYAKRMPETQKEVYFIASDSLDHAMTSPYMQYFIKNDIEVLVGEEPIDEPCFVRLGDLEGKRFVSIEKNEVKIDQSDDEKARFTKLEKFYKPLTEFIRKHMSKRIRNVSVSRKLVDDPMMIYTDTWGYSAYAERVLKAQTFGNTQANSFMTAKHIEYNPNHPIIKRLRELVIDDAENPDLLNALSSLVDNAFLASGFHVEEPRFLTTQFYNMMSRQLGVDAKAKVEDVELPPELEAADDSAGDGDNAGGDGEDASGAETAEGDEATQEHDEL